MKFFVKTPAAITVTVFLAGCVVTPPTADFTVVAEGFTVTFTDTSQVQGATLSEWRWDFGDGETSSQQNPVHVYDAAGDYTVTLTVIDSRGKSGTVAIVITVAGTADEGEEEPEGEQEGEAKALSIIGWVRANTGEALGGVKVSVEGPGIVVYTDAHGLYTVADDIAENAVVVKFEKDSYVTSSVAADLLPDAMTTVNATLIRVADPVVVDSEVGGEADDGSGNKLILPPGALVRRDDGKSVTGEVDVHITPLDVTDPEGLKAFPGEFRAIAAGKSDDTVQLETFALADFTILQDGAELDLADTKGEGATIELVLPETTTLNAGEIVPLWYFDEDLGVWVEQGSGEVMFNKAGTLVYRATVNHLSWWNCDKPISETHCFSGIAVDEDDRPIANARIVAVGLDYGGSSYTTTAADGTFCIDVKRGAEVQIQLYLPGGSVVMDAVEVTAPDTPAQCVSGGCTELSEALTPDLGACVSGVVKDESGVPLANALVRSSLGVTALTDGTGHFCANVTPGVTATFFVLGRPPVTVTTPDAGSCDEGGCLEISLLVGYPDDNDFVGTITSTMLFYPGMRMLNATAMFAGLGPLEADLDTNPNMGCQVFSFDSNGMTEGEVTEGEDEGPWDETMNISILDPGSPGEMSNGILSTPLRRISEIYEGMEVRDYGVFVSDFSEDYDNMYLYEPGDTLSFSWPGGFDIAAFTEAIDLPGDPGQVTPVSVEAVGIPFPLDEALEVLWTPADSDYVEIHLGVMVTNETDDSYEMSIIICHVPDNGAYTIGQDLMQQLPVDSTDTTMTVWMNFSLNNSREIRVPLTHGGDGRMLMTASARTNGSWEEPALPPKSSN